MNAAVIRNAKDNVKSRSWCNRWRESWSTSKSGNYLDCSNDRSWSGSRSKSHALVKSASMASILLP